MSARIITGLIITALFILLCLLAPVWLIYVTLQLAAIIGMLEMLEMAVPNGRMTDRVGALLVGCTITALAYVYPTALPAAVMLAPVVLLGSFLLSPKPIETVAHRMSGGLAAVFYVGMLFAALIYLGTASAGEQSGRVLLLLGAVVMVGDTGAYFVGRAYGRHKLYPAVSPKKTVEGAFGGIAGSVVGAIAVKLIAAPDLAWLDVFLVAVPAGILGQAGDLTESLFKRSYGVKDSGRILPGHGGVLDRLDGVLFAAPYVLLYITMLRPPALG